MAITLRYFDLTGRAQPLRDALSCAGVPFDDVRFSLAEWSSRRDDLPVAGAFGSLPTLTWDGRTISETLPIASFVATRLGERDGLDEVDFALREGIVSCAYLEILLRLGELVWASYLYPGADASRALAVATPRMLAKLRGINAEYDARGVLSLPRSQPCVADFFVREALTIFRHVLGPSRDDRLRARFPRLFELEAWLALQQGAARATRPKAFTARPDEEAVMLALRATDLSALAL